MSCDGARADASGAVGARPLFISAPARGDGGREISVGPHHRPPPKMGSVRVGQVDFHVRINTRLGQRLFLPLWLHQR